MLFELKNPWIEWKIITKVGKRTFDAKIDTGAFVSLIGVDIAVELGLSIDFIKKQRCIRYVGVVEESKGYAFKVPCTSLPLGSTSIPVSEIYIPFTFIEKTRYRFISEDRFLIGTDILNNYNLNVVFSNNQVSKDVDSVRLELLPHGLNLPKKRSLDYTLGQMVKTVDEVLFNSGDGFIEIYEIAEEA